VTAWTGVAQLLADDLGFPGYGAAEANARAWKARVRPEATRGLVEAAMILTGGDAGAALWTASETCPDDKTLAGWAADLEGHLGELLKRCRDMTQACRAAFEGAVAEHEAATATARAAQGRMASSATPDAHAAAEHDHQAAMERVLAASLVIADCEAALEVLARTESQLSAAIDAVRRVPADLAETYETPYQHIRAYGPLPRDGDFLTAAAR
jgi:hypothetical protein